MKKSNYDTDSAVQAAKAKFFENLDNELKSKKPELFKLDAGKPQMALVPYAPVRAIARVLGFGAKKYAPDAWRAKAGEWRRIISAAERHLGAFKEGEDIDPESGEPHLAHLGCCVLFLLEFYEKGLGIDDRYKPGAITLAAREAA